MGNYCTYSDVIGGEGLSGLLGEDISTAFVTKAIEDATAEIDRIVGNPVEIDYEVHAADGNRYIFTLDFTDGGISGIKRVSYNGIVSVQPIPKNADWVATLANWGITNGTLTVASDGPANAASIIVTKVGATTSTLVYPNTAKIPFLAQTIDGYRFIVFWVKPTTANKTFTIRLLKDDSNYIENTFIPDIAGKWNFISLHIDNFTKTGDISYSDLSANRYINKIEIDVADETYSLDGICFAEYYAPVLVSSQFIWTDLDSIPARGTKFEVSYSIDIFATVPDDVKMAAASLASATVWARFGGERYRKTGGVLRVDTLEGKTTRYGFETIVNRYRKMGLEKISGYYAGPEMAWTEEDEDVFG